MCFNVEFDEEKWTKDFAIFQQALWPKYLQTCLNEMYSTDKKGEVKKPIRLVDDEFAELPTSSLNNLPEYDLFEDFLKADMVIEVARSLKYHLMKFVLDKYSPETKFPTREETAKREASLKALHEKCLKEFLHKDEYVHY